MPTLAQARRTKALTQKQVADRMGVTRSLVSAWERGIYKPRLETLQKLCRILGVAIAEVDLNSGPAKTNTASEARRLEIQAHDEAMGYVDSTWLRGGRYDIDPASHEASSI